MNPTKATYDDHGTAVPVVILAFGATGAAFGYYAISGHHFVGDIETLNFKPAIEANSEPEEEKPAPRGPWGAWCPRRLSDGVIRFDVDGLNSQTVTGSCAAEGKFRWYEDSDGRPHDGFDSLDAAREACETFSAARGDSQAVAKRDDPSEQLARLRAENAELRSAIAAFSALEASRDVRIARNDANAQRLGWAGPTGNMDAADWLENVADALDTYHRDIGTEEGVASIVEVLGWASENYLDAEHLRSVVREVRNALDIGEEDDIAAAVTALIGNLREVSSSEPSEGGSK